MRVSTTGTPIGLLIRNKDQRSSDYDELKDVFRPSHADYSYIQKYGIRDHRGGGRSSARETSMRVAAGAIAKKFLQSKLSIEIDGYVSQIGKFKIESFEKNEIKNIKDLKKKLDLICICNPTSLHSRTFIQFQDISKNFL